MNKYIGDDLDKRLQSCKAKSPSVVDAKETTSVIDLVIKAYMDENPNRSHAPMYRSFRSHAISQIRLFLFAGPCRVGARSCVWVMLPVKYCRMHCLRATQWSFSKWQTNTPCILTQRFFQIGKVS